MEKRIFEEQDIEREPKYQGKREFTHSEVHIEQDISAEERADFIHQTIKPSRFWIRLLMGSLILFIIAVIAQSIQWIIESWTDHQWISLLFAVVMLVISLSGVGAIVSEWRKLVWLRQHHLEQQISQRLLEDNSPTSGQTATQFCHNVVGRLADNIVLQQSVTHWQQQMNEGYNGQEVMFLFSQNVLHPIDEHVKKMLTKSATENAILVAISPLAIVDMLMIAWRNIALINKISQSYGMQLGYVSRLRLLRMVLTNMVFAGVTEMATEMGTSFFSHSLASQISLRAGQGVAVGLLTARLGVKAMEFCRPVSFTQQERPTLSVVKNSLLEVMKTTLFNRAENNEREKVQR